MRVIRVSKDFKAFRLTKSIRVLRIIGLLETNLQSLGYSGISICFWSTEVATGANMSLQHSATVQVVINLSNQTPINKIKQSRVSLTHFPCVGPSCMSSANRVCVCKPYVNPCMSSVLILC